jgi:hypothetical protein
MLLASELRRRLAPIQLSAGCGDVRSQIQSLRW